MTDIDTTNPTDANTIGDAMYIHAAINAIVSMYHTLLFVCV